MLRAIASSLSFHDLVSSSSQPTPTQSPDHPEPAPNFTAPPVTPPGGLSKIVRENYDQGYNPSIPISKKWMISAQSTRGSNSLIFAVRQIDREAGNSNRVIAKRYEDLEDCTKQHSLLASLNRRDVTRIAHLEERDIITYKGHHYLILEDRGTSLETYLKHPSSPPLTARKILKIARDIFKALHDLERFRIVHTDINPRHIVVQNIDTEELSSSLIGFDRALVLTPETKETGFIHRPTDLQWQPPERFLATPLKRSEALKFDIWCTAMTMFISYLGESPFPTQTPETDESDYRKTMIDSIMMWLGQPSSELLQRSGRASLFCPQSATKETSSKELLPALSWFNDQITRRGQLIGDEGEDVKRLANLLTKCLSYVDKRPSVQDILYSSFFNRLPREIHFACVKLHLKTGTFSDEDLKRFAYYALDILAPGKCEEEVETYNLYDALHSEIQLPPSPTDYYLVRVREVEDETATPRAPSEEARFYRMRPIHGMLEFKVNLTTLKLR